jgi:hypothetical protein
VVSRVISSISTIVSRYKGINIRILWDPSVDGAIMEQMQAWEVATKHFTTLSCVIREALFNLGLSSSTG